MTQEFSDFYRLATGLRPIKIDFDYVETRKLLDPNWNEYENIPLGHDIIADDVDISEANALTSRHRDSELHRVVLDLDNGACIRPLARGGHVLSLFSTSALLRGSMHIRARELLKDCIVESASTTTHVHELVISTNNDLALIPSTTSGHYHLILDVNMPWVDYVDLLRVLEYYNIIERGYRMASVRKGYSAIRVPWVKKQGKTPGATTSGEREGAPGVGLERVLRG